AASITYNSGVYTVSGSHTYNAAGPYSFTITVTDSGGSTATITGMATVTGAATNPPTAGTPTPPSGSANGTATPIPFVGPPNSPLNAPTDPVFHNGNLYVLNIGANTVSQVPTLGGSVTTAPGSLDAVINPTRLAVDPAGNLYIANGTS